MTNISEFIVKKTFKNVLSVIVIRWINDQHTPFACVKDMCDLK